MKNIILLFLFLIPVFLFAQYPTQGNKSRLGYQTTGDGLIWRGVAADTAIKPRTTANAYFQLDTVNRVLWRYIATQGSWQVVGGTPDLSAYLEIADTAAMLSNYTTFGDISTALGDYLPLQGGTLTGTGGAGFIGFPSQVSAPGTPASGLNVYAQGSSFNWKGTDGYERQFASTLTGGRTYTLPNVSGTFALGTGTATRIPIWTSANAIGDSPILYNSITKRTTWDSPGILELPMGTDAQRPTATTSDFWYNTTGNGIEWYNGTRWAKGLESTANRFTTGSLIFSDGNGQAAQDNANLFWNNSTKRLGIGTTSPSQALEIYTPTTTSIDLFKIQTATNAAANIKFNMNGFQSTISGNLMKITATQGTAPYIQQQTQLIEMGFGTSSSSNKVNILSALNVTGKFGFAFVSNTARIHDAIQQTSFVSGFDRGLDFTTYDHRTNNTLDKGELLFRMSPSKEVWVGDQSVNTNYNFLVTQPSLGYGNIVTTAGSANVTATGTATTWTKDFNVGSTLTVNGNSYTVASITNDYTMSFTTTVPTTGTYAYTITGNTDRFGVYKNGGVVIKGAVGQARKLIDIQNSSLASKLTLNDSGSLALLFNSSDSVKFNITDPYLGSTALISMKGNDSGFDSRWNVADYGYVNHALGISTEDDIRYNFDRSRGTIASPTALIKNDRIGGVYFNAHNGTSYRKTAYIGAVVDSIYSGSNPQSKLIFGIASNDFPEVSTAWRFLIESLRNISVVNHVTGSNMGVGFGSDVSVLEIATIDARFHVKGAGTTTGKTMLLEDNSGADILTITDNKTIQAHGYGTSATTAATLSKTESGYIAGFATDGTVLDLERKRDTTIFVTADTDYDFSAAVTTAQIASRYNRIIIHMTLTSGVGADKTTTLHTPDANLMQCEILIRGTDNTGSYDNEINFGTNNAISSDGTNASGYTLAQGQGLHVRVVYNGSAYKYIYY